MNRIFHNATSPTHIHTKTIKEKWGSECERERIKIPFPKSSHTEHTVYIPSEKINKKNLLLNLPRLFKAQKTFSFLLPRLCVFEKWWLSDVYFIHIYADTQYKQQEKILLGRTIYSSITSKVLLWNFSINF